MDRISRSDFLPHRSMTSHVSGGWSTNYISRIHLLHRVGFGFDISRFSPGRPFEEDRTRC